MRPMALDAVAFPAHFVHTCVFVWSCPSDLHLLQDPAQLPFVSKPLPVSASLVKSVALADKFLRSWFRSRRTLLCKTLHAPPRPWPQDGVETASGNSPSRNSHRVYAVFLGELGSGWGGEDGGAHPRWVRTRSTSFS